MIILIWKNGKIHLQMCKTTIFKIFFPCLYNFTLPKYRTDRIRIQILPKRSGSDRIRKPVWDTSVMVGWESNMDGPAYDGEPVAGPGQAHHLTQVEIQTETFV